MAEQTLRYILRAYLRGGAVVEAEVEDVRPAHDPVSGKLTSFEWADARDGEVRLKYIDAAEVAAYTLRPVHIR